MSITITNKYALHDYEIVSEIEAGIKLLGHEVKSIRAGHLNLKGSYVSVRNGELWLVNAYITPYKKAGVLFNYDPYRPRKLLVHKRDIHQLSSGLMQKGLTLVVLRVYNKHDRLKVSCALVRGKTKYDKRKDIKDRDIKRTIQRAMRSNY